MHGISARTGTIIISFSRPVTISTRAVPAGMPNMKAPATQEEAEKMRDEWMEKMKEMQKQQR